MCSRTKKLCFLTCLVILFAGWFPVVSSESAESGDDVILVEVNGVPITESEVTGFFQLFFMNPKVEQKLNEMPSFYRQYQINMGKRNALQQLINRALLLDAAKEKFDVERINPLIDNIVQERLQRERERVGSLVKFVNFLHTKDITLGEWKKLIGDSVLISNYIRSEVQGRVHVCPEELRRYYQDNKHRFRVPRRIYYRMIVFGSDEEGQDVRRRAEQALAMLEAGADFAKLAGKYSREKGVEGGLHVVDASDAPEGWLPEPVKGLQPGETSGVRSGEFGVYIARLEKVEAAHTLPFEEVQDRVRRILEQKREEELQAELLKRLREGATIEYSDAGAELMDLQGEPGSGE